jgi:hypothetical protein
VASAGSNCEVVPGDGRWPWLSVWRGDGRAAGFDGCGGSAGGVPGRSVLVVKDIESPRSSELVIFARGGPGL